MSEELVAFVVFTAALIGRIISIIGHCQLFCSLALLALFLPP